MGLDAVMYCNCYETGKLLIPPPNPELVYIRPAGDLDCHDPESFVPKPFGDISQEMNDFDNWRFAACPHKGGRLLHHRIGSIWDVADLRSELQQQAQSFPIIVEKVIYSGSHFGDFLDLDDIRVL